MESPVIPPVPAPSEAPSGGRGCARAALIGCGVLAIALLAVIVGLFLYARRNPVFFTDLMMRQVESRYGSDVTEQDKKDLQAAYSDFRTALMERRLDRAAMQRLQFTFSGSRSGTISHEQVVALTRAYRQAVAEGAASPASPAPAPSPTP